MRSLIENLKNLVLNVVTLSTLVASSLTAFYFFLFLFINEAFQGREKNDALFEELSFIQGKIERFPNLFQEFLGWKKPEQPLLPESFKL